MHIRDHMRDQTFFAISREYFQFSVNQMRVKSNLMAEVICS